MKLLYFLVLLLSLSMVVDVDAGWKFWKKKKDEPSSTAGPLEASTASSSSPGSTTKQPSQGPKGPATSPGKGVAAAANPALAIGVGAVGDKIHEDARNQPRKPNPGTAVGLDGPPPKPNAGNTYKSWAEEFGGVSIRDKPQVPGPASLPDARNPAPGNKPASPTASANGQQPPVAMPGAKPESVHGTPPNGQHHPPPAGNSGATGDKAPLPHVAGPTRAPTPVPTPLARPTTPSSQPKPNPGSPTGSKSWSDVVSGGESHPGAPQPAPRPQSPAPLGPGHRAPAHPEPGSPSGQPGRPGISTGAAIGAGVAGAAVAGGAAAPSPSSGKVFSSNPTYSKGNAVTDEDLQKLSEALFAKDVNNANKFITINLQKTTNGDNKKDEAPLPLLQVKPEALQSPTIQKVLTIYDNYKLDTRESEYISPAQRQEESLLVDTFLSTNVMSTAMRFLADKGFVKKDYYEYKDTLRSLWFNLYSRGEGKIGSSGFEHVFLTELKLGNQVSGLHNWIYFNAEELNKRLDYLGYIKKLDLGNKAAIVKAHVRFNGIDKPVTNIFVGTSPELEMALYTVCFLTRSEKPCAVSLGGSRFNIVTHRFRYRGRDLIGSAYPEI